MLRAGAALLLFSYRKLFTSHYDYDHSVLDNGPGSHQCREDTGNSDIAHTETGESEPAEESYGSLVTGDVELTTTTTTTTTIV